jgi:hypothetical protein
MQSSRCTEDERESQAVRKATPAVLNEPRASPRGRNSERNLGEKFHTGCAGQATLTRNSTTGNVRYPGFLAEDLVLTCLRQTLSDIWHDFTSVSPAICCSKQIGNARVQLQLSRIVESRPETRL